jgi:uncharacterized protein
MILLKPFLGCNLKCKYCYQHEIKNRTSYDIDAIIATTDKVHAIIKDDIILHGGEPLCMGYRDVERLLAHSVKLIQHSSIQTNGTLIDTRFIELFKKYKTNVGISLDGNDTLNSLRCDVDTTRKIIKNLHIMLDNKVQVSIIITIHNHNAGTDEQLNNLKAFITSMSSLGVYGRLNPNHSEYALSESRGKEVWLELSKFALENKLVNKWGPFSDVIHSLKQDGKCVCNFTDCDIYSTRAAHVILGDGSQTNCLRTDIMVRHPQQLMTRTEILSQVEQMYGGCKGCKYFIYCKGGCSSNTPDWRLRDTFCASYYIMFDYFYNTLGQFGLFPTQSTNKSFQTNSHGTPGIQHSDGMEHTDGEIKHLDGIAGQARHSDGIEHIDGETRHLDGIPEQECKNNDNVNNSHTGCIGHTDGIEHIDGETQHLDSDMRPK